MSNKFAEYGAYKFQSKGVWRFVKRFNKTNILVKVLKSLNDWPIWGCVKNHKTIVALAFKFPSIVSANKVYEVDRKWRMLQNEDFTDFEDLAIEQLWGESVED